MSPFIALEGTFVQNYKRIAHRERERERENAGRYFAKHLFIVQDKLIKNKIKWQKTIYQKGL